MSTIQTSGTWTAVHPAPAGVTGLDTSHVQWGKGEKKSGYRFEGGSTEAKLDGTEFVLGTFTHDNFPIDSGDTREFDVGLKVQVVFEGGVKSDLSFTFHHNETDNSGPHPNDIVSLPEFISPQTVTVNGEKYKVVLSGFKQGGRVVRQFDSKESSSNSAAVVALFTKPGKPDVAITHVEAKGKVSGSQSDEYVEILNRGTEAADLSGWVLHAESTRKDFTFPEGTVLKPGERYRVYTDERHPDSGGFSFGSGRPVWHDSGDLATLKNQDGKEVSRFPYGHRFTPEPTQAKSPGQAHPHVHLQNLGDEPLGTYRVTVRLPQDGPLRFEDQSAVSVYDNKLNKEVKFPGTVSENHRVLTAEVDLDLPGGGAGAPLWTQVAVDAGATKGPYTVHWDFQGLGAADVTVTVT
ncbi:lamin tail domain-containing protein [Streptomyces sp. p1417]|uniref:Lamin tail domain-containing protein n=1 Tax=Streptomyces typhae TaxID=2681492 RepID=A0A6L6X442_9ACTN|nr:lamin tail domain-containing protein [Streptomyces typhae]MVO88486.1 lamin tail domain-containing protein [Streptomyces typhae]